MDRIPQDFNKKIVPSTDDGADNNTDKEVIARTNKGRSVQSVTKEKQISTSHDNKSSDRKLAKRAVTSEQLKDNIKQASIVRSSDQNSVNELDNSNFSLDNSGIELDSLDYEPTKKTSATDAHLSAAITEVENFSGEDKNKPDNTFVLSDMLFDRETLEPLKKVVAQKKNADALSHKEVSRVNRSINKFFDDNNIPSLLGKALMQQLEYKKIPLQNVSNEIFLTELNILLEDLHERGISVSSKMEELESRPRTSHTKAGDIVRNSKKRIKEYIQNYSKLDQFDRMLEEYINSEKCPKWNSSQPIYRGGDAMFERKTLRNQEKEKPLFRRDLVNRGLVAHGYGQYYTDDPNYAEAYAKDTDNPVLLTVNLKENTPIISDIDIEEFHENSKFDGNWETFLNYIQPKQPIILPHSVMTTDANGNKKIIRIYTVPNSSVIDGVSMRATGDITGTDTKAEGELSIHRLDKNNRILGQPKSFKEVMIPDDAKLEKTNFIACGHKESEELPVMKCKIDGENIHVVKSPEEEGIHWQVKQMPESLKKEQPVFIVEPSGDFLVQRKQEKLAALHSQENQPALEQKAEKSQEAIRSFFDLACLERLEELEDLADDE